MYYDFFVAFFNSLHFIVFTNFIYKEACS